MKVKEIEAGHTTDHDLVGLTGTLSRKFFITENHPFHVYGDVGVWLDQAIGGARAINVYRNELELVSLPSYHE